MVASCTSARSLSRPIVVLIAVQHLTTLTTEEIVAELGWTRKAIQTVLGVTPTTMRPPYGDIGA